MLFGLQNRDLGCAWSSQQRQIILALKNQNFHVHLHVIELKPLPGDLIDGLTAVPGSLAYVADSYRELEYSQVLAEQHIFCRDVDCRFFKKTVGWQRQTYSIISLVLERYVSEFLSTRSDNLSVVLGTDFYVQNPLLTDVERCLDDSNIVLICGNNPDEGFTDGFYVGAPKTLARITNRLNPMYFSPNFLPRNYEAQLKEAFQRTGIKTDILKGHEMVRMQLAKIRHSGGVWGQRGQRGGIKLSTETIDCLNTTLRRLGRPIYSKLSGILLPIWESPGY